LPYADASFDLVSCNSVFEHVDHHLLPAIMRELDRVLKPGGKILITGTGSRLWPVEMRSRKWFRWFINYVPRFMDPLLGAPPAGFQRGLSPWCARYGFGRHYLNLDALDHGQAFLRARAMMNPPSDNRIARTVVKLSKLLAVGPGLLMPNLSCLLQKQS
jgi:SAM-dependent methyltransferase